MMEKLNRFGALKGISELGGINSGTGLLDKLRQISTALGGEAGRSNIEEQISDLRRQTAGMVYVVWDSGTKANYRAGIRGLHDLRIVDSAATGVKHLNVRCNGPCGKTDIFGMRWECCECGDNFCSACFYRISNSHHLDTAVHTSAQPVFKRYDTPESSPVEVTLNERSVPLKGIFPNAKVKRGSDWCYGDEDNKDVGEVIKADETVPGRVQVKWRTNDYISTYRLGLDGKTDLRLDVASVGGYYQPHSLPILIYEESPEDKKKVTDRKKTFTTGDRVKIVCTPSELRAKQAGHGGWVPDMDQFIGAPGTVGDTLGQLVGIVIVHYYDVDKKWAVNAEILEKLSEYSVGQAVRIIHDETIVSTITNQRMKRTTLPSIAGQIGHVVKVNDDGLVHVELDNDPELLKDIALKPEWIESLSLAPRLYNKLSKLQTKLVSLLLEAVHEGDLSVVKDLTEKYKIHVDMRDTKRAGSTALQMACRSGHVDIAEWLIEQGADPEKEDNKGRRAIHQAAKGGQLDVLQFLLNRGVDINSVTKRRLTALQKAVAKHYTECVLLLISQPACDVDSPDSDGDTPLHNAVLRTRNQVIVLDDDGLENSDGSDMVATLISSGRADLYRRNNRGLNVLHLAVIVGNYSATKYLLNNGGSDLVTQSFDNSLSTALHHACNRRNHQIGKLLVEHMQRIQTQSSGSDSLPSTPSGVKKSFIDPQSKNGLTPLMVACYKSDFGLVELLVNAGADLSLVDKDGDNALIMTAIKLRTRKKFLVPNKESAPTIYQLYQGMKDEFEQTMGKYPSLAIICYLIERGCDLKATNKRGRTVIDILDDPQITSFLEHFALPYEMSREPFVSSDQTTTSTPRSIGTSLCIFCSAEAQAYIFPDCDHGTDLACFNCIAKIQRCTTCRRQQRNVDRSALLVHELTRLAISQQGYEKSLETEFSVDDDKYKRSTRQTGTIDVFNDPEEKRMNDIKLPNWTIDDNGHFHDGQGNKYERGMPQAKGCRWRCISGRNCPAYVRELDGRYTIPGKSPQHKH